jgi:hypothetical protein
VNGAMIITEIQRTQNTKGKLSKAFYKIDNQVYLVKGNSKGHYEPIAEFIGSQLAQRILSQNKLVYVPDCRLMESYYFGNVKCFDNFKYISATIYWGNCRTLQFQDYVNLDNKKLTAYNYLQWILSYGSDELKMQTAIMLFIDAILGNTDRHLGNWDIDLEKQIIPGLIDFGESCLAVSWCKGKQVSVFKPDNAKPFAPTHLQQLDVIKLLATDKLIITNPKQVVSSYLTKIIKTIDKEYRDYLFDLYSYVVNRAEYFTEIFSDYLDVRNE